MSYNVLPPGTESNDYTYGYMAIRIGNIAYKHDQVSVRLTFWGQNSNSVLLHAHETIKYDIRCPIILFSRYLEDSVDLKIQLIDRRNTKVIGYSLIRWSMYLKKQLSDKDTSPLLEIDSPVAIFKNQ